MEKTILISEMAKETRIAILENGELVEFFVEKPEKNRLVGSIFKGKVENVIEGIQAAFVDIGYATNAFLPFSEIEDSSALAYIENISRDEEEDEQDVEMDLKPSRKIHLRSGDVNLKKNQEILVQVIKEPFAKKGARVTTNISLPGRFLVLVPNADYIGISRKIFQVNEKRRLRQIAKSIKPPKFGIIIRTVAQGKDAKSLRADLTAMMRKWKQLEENVKNSQAPACVYADMEMSATIIRDLLTPDVDKIIVDTKDLYRNILAYIKSTSPEFVNKLEYYHSKNPLFEQYNVEKEFEKSLSKKIWLKSGGFIVIEHTEAMTTIDVNSGKFIGKNDQEANSLKINLQAAKEIARQLRLRDVGGLIMIDFIDMEIDENKRKVVQETKRELHKDRAKVSVANISDFGILEMTRQRTRLNLLHSVSEECPTCHGSGRVTSKGSIVTKIESWFRRFKIKSRERRLDLHVHPDFASYLKESTSRILFKIQLRNLIRIKLVEDSTVNIDEFRVLLRKSGRDVTNEY
ncbi:MAG: Rne/Rng family ribonuclease [Candidatus Marinimicrobia bacterium]|nr:Rne/Rng family ribonuclease [Candidatus Neomarinimicrobiota bacterium]MCK9483127.1 Rne/Rng family ribonuclease [Candidatus Neomarinimicrobiota bacterium]MDD5539260.1 Rne/Rng family ribonuclease [Candidatus Neomarinimicrobiota bacterium]